MVSSWRVGLIILCIGIGFDCIRATFGKPVMLSENSELSKLVPKDAYDGPGCWLINGVYIATGSSISIDSLGKTKGKHLEAELAKKDAKQRIILDAACRKYSKFNEDSYIVTGKVSGFEPVGIFRKPPDGGLYLIGIAKQKDVKVAVEFDPVKGKKNALIAFDACNYKKAAKLFSALTQRGIQDENTVKLAQAASMHVNLLSGIGGDSRLEALRFLGDFYFQRNDLEGALKYYYQLYREKETPERVVLERLAKLCRQTSRDTNAAQFQKEIIRRWPDSSRK